MQGSVGLLCDFLVAAQEVTLKTARFGVTLTRLPRWLHRRLQLLLSQRQRELTYDLGEFPNIVLLQRPLPYDLGEFPKSQRQRECGLMTTA